MTFEQAAYQVRFEWGQAGLEAIGADADVVVWVDAIATVPTPDLLPVAPAAAVIDVDVRTSAAAARWLLALQERLARRITIAVVAAGDRRADGSSRCAVEDQLAAGSVISHLGAVGIDATSPEAATAEAAYRQLARALGHLVSAGVTGRAAAVRPASFRVAEELGAEAVVVRRQHPDAGAARRQSGVKWSAIEFMQ
jgi:2-phosphosulfolactate phosphatase